MSMLAEPKRKKAWILNPKGSQWSNDETKFGQRMLEQMGWSKGQGLGKEKDGITEHIRPAVQNDARGLGYEGRTDDWVAHLDDFNDLLAKLQNAGAAEPASSAATVNSKSLEERSKKSRARVHYHKFTRGKDLSRASSQDLACILGGRGEAAADIAGSQREATGAVAASQPVTPVSSRPPSPPRHADSDPEPECGDERTATVSVDSNGLNTINTGLSCKDYFAEKMRKWKEERQKRQNRIEPISEETTDASADVSATTSEQTTELDAVEATGVVSSAKKSKKKKGLRADNEMDVVNDKNDVQFDGSDRTDGNRKDKSKRKKKKRQMKSGDDQTEQTADEDAKNKEKMCMEESDLQVDSNTDQQSHKKKKKEKKEKSADTTQPQRIIDAGAVESLHKKKKPKAAAHLVDDTSAGAVDWLTADAGEVSAKRKRKYLPEPSQATVDSEPSKKKKKKRKTQEQGR